MEIDATDVFRLRHEILSFNPIQWNIKGAPSRINLLCFGGMGAGKSSLSNTILSARGTRIERRALVKPVGGTTVTTQYILRQVTPHIYLGDAWGWKADNYTKREFEYMLQGRLKFNFNSESKEDQAKIDSFLWEHGSKEAEANKIHCVLFAFPIRSHDNATYLGKLKEFQKVAEDAGVPYLVVLTQTDTEDENLKRFPQFLPASETVNKIRTTLSGKLGIAAHTILPTINYTDQAEDESSEIIDILALQVLRKAVVTLQDFFRDLQQ